MKSYLAAIELALWSALAGMSVAGFVLTLQGATKPSKPVLEKLHGKR